MDVIIEKSGSLSILKFALHIISFSPRQDLKSCDLFFAHRPDRTETFLPRTSNLRTFVRQSDSAKTFLHSTILLNLIPSDTIQGIRK